MTTKYKKHYAEIEPGLFLGSMFATSPEILQSLGITHVYHLGFSVAVPLPNVVYEFIDLEDNSFGTNKMLEYGEFISNKIIRKTSTDRILICCVAGRSRSASMMVFTLKKIHPDWDFNQIIAFIKEKRTISINLSFMDALRKHLGQ